MTADVRSQLQATLTGAYTLERELGGGGMSRVFVAEETRLGRKVVVKVLSPELAAGISADRFEREIKVAASLQQANIVPLLNAGESAGLPYYTMPFVEGESLRIRLQRGALPIGEAVNVLRDVARALAYAHERGIVHRDIKPDNVLLSGGAAVVTDFGIAKAISASRTASGEGATLTQLGTSIGTPAYISPEQAAGDPDVDHRADIYSFGCMAYELLAGRPPFVAKTPQRLLGAHMSEMPQPITELRPDTPPALAAMVMRTLEKEPSARPQSAAELFPALDATPTSDAGYGAMPSILLGGRGMLKKALALYAAAVIVVAIVAKAAIVGIGLPDWVFPGALIAMALGLPVILFTAYVHHVNRRIATATSPTLTPGGSAATHGTMATIAVRATPHLTWKRVTLGGAWSIGMFIVLVGGYMLLRALGIGPAGSLLAKGVMATHDRVIVADFRAPGTDSLLGAALSEAIRSDLAQSNAIAVAQPTTITAALRRMQRPVDAPLDLALAREIAQREGIKAVVEGEARQLGAGYIVTARLVSATTGEALASFRETASDPKELIAAVGRLSRSLRERVGESLRSVQASPALERATTTSLEALRQYAAGAHAIDWDVDYDRGVPLLEEAVRLDTSFAMAYRKLGLAHPDLERKRAYLERAFRYRDRLTLVERYMTEGVYYANADTRLDIDKSIAAYVSLIDIEPRNASALMNMGLDYFWKGDQARAAEYYRRAWDADTTRPRSLADYASAAYESGHPDDARRAVSELERRFPNNAYTGRDRMSLATAEGHYDSAAALIARSQATSTDRLTRARLLRAGANVERLRGRLRRTSDMNAEAAALERDIGVSSAGLREQVGAAGDDAWTREDPTSAQRRLDSALVTTPLRTLGLIERASRSLEVATAYAMARRPDRARAILATYDAEVRDSAILKNQADDWNTARGWTLLAERRADEAVAAFRAAAAHSSCAACVLPPLALAYDLAGAADSTIAVNERYLAAPVFYRLETDAIFRAPLLKRLGELYEAKGERQKAAGYYGQFIELWKTADPELQPKVAEVKKRLARLSDTEKR